MPSARFGKVGKLVAMALVGSLSAAAGLSSDGRGMRHPNEEGFVGLHEGADWYRARSESENRWSGVLRRRSVGLGPGSRTAVSFALVTADGELPVYAAGVEGTLQLLLDRHVEVVGKIVDLREEGFGRELWIGSLRPVTMSNEQE